MSWPCPPLACYKTLEDNTSTAPTVPLNVKHYNCIWHVFFLLRKNFA